MRTYFPHFIAIFQPILYRVFSLYSCKILDKHVEHEVVSWRFINLKVSLKSGNFYLIRFKYDVHVSDVSVITNSVLCSLVSNADEGVAGNFYLSPSKPAEKLN